MRQEITTEYAEFQGGEMIFVSKTPVYSVVFYSFLLRFSIIQGMMSAL